MKKFLFVFATLMAFSAVGEERPTVPYEVKKAIKLTTKNLPIARYFSDEDEDDQQVAPRTFLFRRDTAVKAKTDITPSEDEYVIPDSIKLRLMLARIRAVERFNQVHGSV